MSTLHVGTLADRVKKCIAEQLDVDVSTLADDTHLYHDLHADSLDMLELVMSIEDEFGIEIPDEQADEVRTVKDAVELVASMVEG